MKKKRILVLKACGIKGEDYECEGICEHAALYDLDVVCREVKDNRELVDAVSLNGKFDYIYLSAHGCADSFGNYDNSVDMNWGDFASLICSANCMNEDSVLMLSCCRGGLMQVAYTMFYTCSNISYVLGPRQSLGPADMHICFGIFLYNMEIRKTDPIVACERIKYVTDQRFSCYDREEEEININNYILSGCIQEMYEKICPKEESDKE